MSVSVHVVTSASRKGWDACGTRFLQSFCRYWPIDFTLDIVSEDKLPVHHEEYPHISAGDPRRKAEQEIKRKVRVWNLLESHAQAAAFYQRHLHNPLANGRITPPGARRKAGGYNFLFDAVKFSKKVFSIDLIATMNPTGRLIWIDVDTYTYVEIPRDMAFRMPPMESALACLDRGRYHSECGFVGYNLTHPSCMPFIRAFADTYAEDRVFQIPEFHDSYVFDYVRRSMGVPAYHIPHSNPAHPFVFSELGRYMDHLKGRRKDFGVSPEHPRLGTRAKGYGR